MLIAGAFPIRRLELSRCVQSYGDWFPNCGLSGRRVLAQRIGFQGVRRRWVRWYIARVTVGELAGGCRRAVEIHFCRGSQGAFGWARYVTDENHRAMTNPVLQLRGAALAMLGDGFVGDVDLLYFSIVTASTVGYGDTYPIKPLAKVMVASEIFCIFSIVVLLLSAFSLSATAPGESDKES